MTKSMPEKLRQHVDFLCIDCHPRNFQQIKNLNKCADYIAQHLQQAGASSVTRQKFTAIWDQAREYQNVIAHFGPATEETIIIGAHYDTCADTPGADDNASAVAGLIETAYLLGKHQDKLTKRFKLVAFTLEEPPFFRTESMGSIVHAKSMIENNTKIKFAVIYEMIGFYSEEKNSQRYPLRFLKWFYPTTGNFVAVASTVNNFFLVRKMKRKMRQRKLIKVCGIVAPELIDIHLSDHKSYIDVGIPALMVTDTANYRNDNYHELTDTPDTLNYEKMANVVESVVHAVIEMQD